MTPFPTIRFSPSGGRSCGGREGGKKKTLGERKSLWGPLLQRERKREGDGSTHLRQLAFTLEATTNLQFFLPFSLSSSSFSTATNRFHFRLNLPIHDQSEYMVQI